MSLKRTLSQSGPPPKKINNGRRCVIVDCPNIPGDSNVKCAECSAELCNVRTCTNVCKTSPDGRRKFKRCEAHTQRHKPGGVALKKSVELGVSVSESKIEEAEDTVTTTRSDIKRQYHHGVIVGENEVRQEKTEKRTLRVTLVNCVKHYMEARTTELFNGAPHNDLAVASAAIQVAFRDRENNTFEDVLHADDDKTSFYKIVKSNVALLKALHERALEQCAEQRASDQLHRDEQSGSLTPRRLAEKLDAMAKALFKVCKRKEFHPLCALYAAASNAWSSLLACLANVLELWAQDVPVNAKPDEKSKKKHINDLFRKEAKPEEKLEAEELPAVKSTPDWTCGLTLQHFEALGHIARKNGAWIWSLLDCVNRLNTKQHVDVILYSWVTSAQLRVRCAHGHLQNLGVKEKEFEVVSALTDAAPPAITSFMSPCVSMHQMNSDHEDSAVCVRMKLSRLPEADTKTGAASLMRAEDGWTSRSSSQDSQPELEPTKKPLDIEFVVYLPHQYMMVFLQAFERPGSSGTLDVYFHSRRKSLVSKVRNDYLAIKKTAKRTVCGIPLDRRLLEHQAFEPLLDHATRNGL